MNWKIWRKKIVLVSSWADTNMTVMPAESEINITI